MPELTATNWAFILFFICLPIVMWRFFKIGFLHGAEMMVKQLHESSYLTSKCVKDLGLALEVPDEDM